MLLQSKDLEFNGQNIYTGIEKVLPILRITFSIFLINY